MRNSRQEKLLELIEKKSYVTQDELQEDLQAAGFQVTQSTVSRDIKQLRIVKALDPFGNYRYSVSAKSGEGTEEAHPNENYVEMFRRSVRRISQACNDIVLNCYSGMASSAALSVEKLFDGRFLGCVAGDDTVLIVTTGEDTAVSLAGELKRL